jgi:hypothetical protein
MLDGSSKSVTVGQVVDLAKSEIVGGAPEWLDTLDEIAAAINDDDNLAATLTAQISTKADSDDVDIPNLISKFEPQDADLWRIWDSTGLIGERFKTLSFANFKAWLAKIPRIIMSNAVTASGAAIDFTAIPAGVNRVKLKVAGLSTNGADSYRIQLGTSSGFETSGYLGASSVIASGVSVINDTAGFPLSIGSAAATNHGVINLERLSGNQWVVSGMLARSDNTVVAHLAGSKTLAGLLDRVRLTTSGGANVFDAGTVAISWEY